MTTPTWKNTLYSRHASIGMRDIMQSRANGLGYPFYEWNGWVYDTRTGANVCLAEKVDERHPEPEPPDTRVTRRVTFTVLVPPEDALHITAAHLAHNPEITITNVHNEPVHST